MVFRVAVTTPRPLVEALILAILLPAVAGAVNAVGFFAVGTYTSHMSGAVARFGDEAAQGHFSTALFIVGMVVAFGVGAAVCTMLIIFAAKRERARYVATLLIQSLTLAVYAVLVLTTDHPERLPREFIPVALLCFSMGLQNAMVTKISGAVVRTTHLTGVVTDISIESVRLAYAFLHRSKSQGFQSWLGENPDWKKLRLHVAIFLAFATGAVVGPIVYLQLGPLTMFIPVVFLIALGVFDIRLGLVTTHGHLSWHEHSDPHAPLHR